MQDPERVAERDAKLAALGPRPPWWRPLTRRRWARRRDVIMAVDVTWLATMLRGVYSPDEIGRMACLRHPAFAALSVVAVESNRAR